MSLEQAIKDLTQAIEENTKAVSGAESKPAAKPAAKATGRKPAAKKKDDDITVDDLAEAFGTYLNDGNAAAKKKAKAVVKGIVANFDAPRVTEMDPSDFKEAKDLLDAYIEGEDPLSLFEDDEGDDDSPI